MVFLTQRKQLGVAAETVEGTAETIAASDIATVLNPAASIELNNIRRAVQRGSFSKVTSGTGIQVGTVTYEQEFSGPFDGAVTSLSPLDVSLRACGFRAFDLYALKVDAMSGTRLAIGDILTATVGGSGGSGATIRLVAHFSKDVLDDALASGDVNTHGDVLFFEQVSGTVANTDTLLSCLNPGFAAQVSHAGTSPLVTISSQVPVRVGTGWLPTSFTTQTLDISGISGTFQTGEIILQGIDNASIAAALEVAYGVVVDTDNSTYIEYVPLEGSGHAFENAGLSAVTGLTSAATATVDSDGQPTQSPTVTAKLFEDGITKTFAGCRGTCVMNFPTGEFPLLNVSLQGAYNAVADEANFTSGTPLQAAVPTFLGIEFRIDREWIPCTSSISIDMGQNLVQRTCAGNASGLEGFAITDRTPTMTMDPEAVAEAVANAYTDAKNANAFPITLRFGNFSSGTGMDAWMISADQVQYEALNSGDRDGIITHDATMQINSYSTVNDADISVLNYKRQTVDAI